MVTFMDMLVYCKNLLFQKMLVLSFVSLVMLIRFMFFIIAFACSRKRPRKLWYMFPQFEWKWFFCSCIFCSSDWMNKCLRFFSNMTPRFWINIPNRYKLMHRNNYILGLLILIIKNQLTISDIKRLHIMLLHRIFCLV